MLGLALDAVTSFSVVLLRMISVLGFLVFMFSAGMGLWTLWIRLFTQRAVPGWTSTLLPIYVLGGLENLLAQVCATGLVLFWNFVGNSLWTFGVDALEDMHN